MNRKNLFLLLAIIGGVVPYLFFGSFIATNGVDLPLFGRLLFANGAVAGFSADLLITSFIFWFWSYPIAQKRGLGWRWWVCVLVNLTVGLSCAFPLFLYFAEGER